MNPAYQQLKSSNERLKILEQMEKETSRKLKQGIENIQNIKIKRHEEKIKKELEVIIF